MHRKNRHIYYIAENVWNTAKIRKIACIYFQNSSASGGPGLRPCNPLGDSSPDPLWVCPHPKPPSTAFAKEVVRRYLPPLWCRTSVPTAHTTTPLQRGSNWAWAQLLPVCSGAVVWGCLCSIRGERHPGGAGGATLLSVLVCSLPNPLSVLLALWYGIIVTWLLDGWTHKCPVTPTPSHSQYGGVRAACINASTGWRQSTDCLWRQLIVATRDMPSSILHFCSAGLVQIFIQFYHHRHALFMTFIFIICVSSVLQLQHYCITCFVVGVTSTPFCWLLVLVRNDDCYRMLKLWTWCLSNVNLFN